MYDVADDGVDLARPAPAAEDAVMADAGLHVMPPQIGPDLAAQLLRRERLADGADIVLLALDREQRRAPDRPRIDQPATDAQPPQRQIML